jgi:hypothetical protein
MTQIKLATRVPLGASQRMAHGMRLHHDRRTVIECIDHGRVASQLSCAFVRLFERKHWLRNVV